MEKDMKFPKKLLKTINILGFHPNLLLVKNYLYAINYLTKEPLALIGSR